MEPLTIILSILGAIGSNELIKYILTWVREKKKDKLDEKQEEIENDSLHFNNFKDQVTFLNKQIEILSIRLKEKQEELNKFDSQFQELTQKIYNLQMELMESDFQVKKNQFLICNDRKCQNRQQ